MRSAPVAAVAAPCCCTWLSTLTIQCQPQVIVVAGRFVSDRECPWLALDRMNRAHQLREASYMMLRRPGDVAHVG